MLGIGIQWILTRTGHGATTHVESGGFIRSREGLAHPDIQFHFLPGVVNDHGRVNPDRHSFQVNIFLQVMEKKSSPKYIYFEFFCKTSVARSVFCSLCFTRGTQNLKSGLN